MAGERKLKIEELPQADAEALTPEEAEQAQGGAVQLTQSTYYADPRNLAQLNAHPSGDPIPSN
jgi:hypothetical protein